MKCANGLSNRTGKLCRAKACNVKKSHELSVTNEAELQKRRLLDNEIRSKIGDPFNLPEKAFENVPMIVNPQDFENEKFVTYEDEVQDSVLTPKADTIDASGKSAN